MATKRDKVVIMMRGHKNRSPEITKQMKNIMQFFVKSYGRQK